VNLLGILITLLLPDARALEARDLKTGDVLLQSIPCYICNLIQIEEGAPYSHIGVVEKQGEKILVLQAWQKVQALNLVDSIHLRRPHTTTLVLRPVDSSGHELTFDPKRVDREFYQNYNGLDYDEAFLWDNTDSNGEKLYCSEFVAKFMNRFLPTPIATKPMHYNQFRPDWVTYFKGNPPDGKPGISPADFYFSPLFKKLGEIGESI
jgi:hypothetical protein